MGIAGIQHGDPAMKPMTHEQRMNWLYAGLGCVAVIACALYLRRLNEAHEAAATIARNQGTAHEIMAAAARSSGHSDLDGVYALSFPGASTLPVATTEADLDDFTSALNAHDHAREEKLLLSGRIMAVAASTRVRRVDLGLITVMISILDGACAGEQGWLPGEHVR